MAVLEAVRGIKVTVCVDDQALQEYDDNQFKTIPGDVGDYQASRTVARYVESCTDKEFSIKVEVDETYKFDSPTLSLRIFIDGSRVCSPHTDFDKKMPWTKLLTNCFLEGVDDSKLASVKEDAKRLSVVGEIVVKVYRRGERRQSSRQSHPVKFNVDTSTPVHERALKGKAMSHGTALGAPQAIEAPVYWNIDFIDGKDYPIAIYRFKYRSKESLKSLLILPRTPEPSPSPSPSPIPDVASGPFDLDNLDAAQKVQLQEFLGKMLGNGTSSIEKKKIKQEKEEKTTKEEREQNKNKREREEAGSGSRVVKRSRVVEYLEIDLTGDSD
ncbi:hypothetical protein NHQ30_002718 [Ciborinia camelliae]|nr:hypothetical protein NHQ30_002718 [Ciborinia camelliae]